MFKPINHIKEKTFDYLIDNQTFIKVVPPGLEPGTP